MQIDPAILSFLTHSQILALFLGSFFFGESVIIAAGVLAAYGIWSPMTVFWVALSGTLLSDSAWFFGGKHFFRQMKKFRHTEALYERIVETLDRRAGRRPFLVLLFIKFLYGTRILSIIYLSLRRLSYRLFLIFDALGSVIWLIAMIGIGWSIGKGLSSLLPVLRSTQLFILSLLIVMLLVTITVKWLSKKITK